MEDFGDDDDPFSQLMEDLLLEEIKDHEAERTQKIDDKRSREESLVSGGNVFHNKVARQILGGDFVVIGGAEHILL